MTYQVKIEAFEGPFDLLLHLIAKREVDIYEVSLAQITEEYLDHLKAMQDLDLDIATEFLLVAATLIEIKAARLLPGNPVDEESQNLLSERDLLIARLLEYRAFKEAADALRTRFEENTGYYGRPGPGREFDHLCPDILKRVTLDRFAQIAVRAMSPKPEPPALDVSHVTPILATVSDAVALVLRALAERKTIRFRDVTSGAKDRIDVVVRFLALLELIKRGHAHVDQDGAFGEIRISAGDAPVEAETYDVEEGW